MSQNLDLFKALNISNLRTEFTLYNSIASRKLTLISFIPFFAFKLSSADFVFSFFFTVSLTSFFPLGITPKNFRIS